MKKVLLINQTWFAQPLSELGYEVVVCQDPNSLPNLIKNSWDLVFYLDNSCIPLNDSFLLLDAVKVFYAVDVHLHKVEEALMSSVYDVVLVAQKSYVDFFKKFNENAYWLPLFAPKINFEKNLHRSGLCFVGNLDLSIHEQRKKFLRKLQKYVPLKIINGSWQDIYPHFYIVVNKSIRDDLNLRVFEALASNCLLITDHADGLFDLFENNREVITYSNFEECIEKVEYFLSNRAQGDEIRNRAHNKFLNFHTEYHRTLEILKILSKIKIREKTQLDFKRYKLGKLLWLKKIYSVISSNNVADIDNEISKLMPEVSIF